MHTSFQLFGDCGATAETGNTVIIFGMARGGTSMVAGAVRGFGYDLGQNLDVNMEDGDFNFKTDDHICDAIANRNCRLTHWGWKYPMAVDYLDRITTHIRNPVFIIVSRDNAATSLGLMRWEAREAASALAEVVVQSQRNLNLALRLRCPTLYVSYEKALANPSAFIDELAFFLKRPLSVELNSLLKFMKPGSYKSFEECTVRI